MAGLGDLMKQAQQVQERMQEMQAELAALQVTGEAGAGLVKVTLNGRHEARGVQIDPSVFSGTGSEDREVLEDLIAAAINDAVRRVEAAQKEKMAGLASNMGLPPGFQFPT